MDTARNELNQAREELAELRPTRRLLQQSQKTNRELENAIAILQAELNDRLEEAAKTKTFLTEELQQVKAQLGEKEQAIANLTTENQKLEGWLTEAAKTEIFLSEKLQRFKYGIVPGDEPCGEQLQLFPTPEELPPEEQAAVTPELLTRQPEQLSVISNQSPVISEEQPPAVNSEGREVGRGELIGYIQQRFPKAKINPQNITDAINGKSKKLPEYERLYGFKYIGQIEGKHRFKILNQS